MMGRGVKRSTRSDAGGSDTTTSTKRPRRQHKRPTGLEDTRSLATARERLPSEEQENLASKFGTGIAAEGGSDSTLLADYRIVVEASVWQPKALAVLRRRMRLYGAVEANSLVPDGSPRQLVLIIPGPSEEMPAYSGTGARLAHGIGHIAETYSSITRVSSAWLNKCINDGEIGISDPLGIVDKCYSTRALDSKHREYDTTITTPRPEMIRLHEYLQSMDQYFAGGTGRKTRDNFYTQQDIQDKRDGRSWKSLAKAFCIKYRPVFQDCCPAFRDLGRKLKGGERITALDSVAARALLDISGSPTQHLSNPNTPEPKSDILTTSIHVPISPIYSVDDAIGNLDVPPMDPAVLSQPISAETCTMKEELDHSFGHKSRSEVSHDLDNPSTPLADGYTNDESAEFVLSPFSTSSSEDDHGLHHAENDLREDRVREDLAIDPLRYSSVPISSPSAPAVDTTSDGVATTNDAKIETGAPANCYPAIDITLPINVPLVEAALPPPSFQVPDRLVSHFQSFPQELQSALLALGNTVIQGPESSDMDRKDVRIIVDHAGETMGWAKSEKPGAITRRFARTNFLKTYIRCTISDKPPIRKSHIQAIQALVPGTSERDDEYLLVTPVLLSWRIALVSLNMQSLRGTYFPDSGPSGSPDDVGMQAIQSYVDRLIDGAKRHFGKAVSGDSKLVLGSPVTRSEVECESNWLTTCRLVSKLELLLGSDLRHSRSILNVPSAPALVHGGTDAGYTPAGHIPSLDGCCPTPAQCAIGLISIFAGI